MLLWYVRPAVAYALLRIAFFIQSCPCKARSLWRSPKKKKGLVDLSGELAVPPKVPH